MKLQKHAHARLRIYGPKCYFLFYIGPNFLCSLTEQSESRVFRAEMSSEQVCSVNVC